MTPATRRATVARWALAVSLGLAGILHGLEADLGAASDAPRVLLVLGAPGEVSYQSVFDAAGRSWEEACQRAGASLTILGRADTNAVPDRTRLEQALASESKETAAELWLILIGHGTFGGGEAKFNLRGPDVTAPMLAEWLQPFRRPLVVVNAASASGAFLPSLSASNRVVITATRSGDEQNYARFGEFFSRAVADPGADIDRDGQTSLLEAFLNAARGVAAFYGAEGRLATEHALLDDNGDARGTPADWFRGLRAQRKAEGGAALDGMRAHQVHLARSAREQLLPPEARRRRDELERAISDLRDRKTGLTDEDYYRKLEALLLELARIYAKARS